MDTGLGGRIRYSAILGYLNTSLNLNPENGLITISTNNHGFDREQMPEYRLYVEARDNDGMGNSAQVAAANRFHSKTEITYRFHPRFR